MTVQILRGDCRDVLRTLPDESVHCVVTSPPYFGLRDYGVAGQIGLEASPAEFVAELVAVFREVRRVLRTDGTCWVNLGDSYASSPGQGTRGGPPSASSTLEGNGHKGGGPKLAQLSRVGRSGNKGSRASDTGGRPAAPGLKPKDMIGIPWAVAFALRDDGWYLRQDIIWSKPNPMPESVRDRCTKAHEYLFLLSKSERYFYDQEPIREPVSANWSPDNAPTVNELGSHVLKEGQRKQRRMQYDEPKGANRRSVWSVATEAFSEAHFATFPPALVEPCIKAGCPAGGTVLDPFGGAGTTAMVADRLGRDAILIELNPDYAEIAERRYRGDAGMFAEVTA